MIVMAGDIGGTNTRLALFEEGAVTPLLERTYPSASESGLEAIAEKFLVEARVAAPALSGPPERACFGIAGPVEGNVCRATNLPWIVEGRVLSQRLGIARVRLVNDFYAAALGSVSVPSNKLAALGGGPREPRAPVAVVGAGTGLGQAFLLWSPTDDRYQAISSEEATSICPPDAAGERSAAVPRGQVRSRLLRARAVRPRPCRHLLVPGRRARVPCAREGGHRGSHGDRGSRKGDLAPRARRQRSPLRRDADVFSSVLGALAGNLALTLLAKGGVFVAGGIAPRIVPFLQRGFREAFEGRGGCSRWWPDPRFRGDAPAARSARRRQRRRHPVAEARGAPGIFARD